MLDHKTKATPLQKLMVGLLIVGNIGVASFIVVQSRAKQGHPLMKEIPSELLLGDELIKSRLFELAEKSNSGKAVMVMLVSIERVGSAQLGGDLGCDDLLGCLNKQSCGMKGSNSGCVITCQDETVITCPKAPPNGD